MDITPITNSAAKIVFILMAIAVVALTFMKIIDGKDFMILASMTFAYYFTDKGDPSLPGAGK